MEPLLKEAALLNKKAVFRKEKGLFVAEGLNLCEEAPPERIRALFYTDAFAAEHPAFFRERAGMRAAGVPFLRVPENDFLRASDTRTPQGVMALVSCFRYDADQLLCRENGLFLILETLQDPGNLGTILRSAEAAGVTAVFIGAGSADIYNPKTVRATMGALFRVPFIENVCVPDVVRMLGARGIKTCAAALQGSVPYDSVDYTGPSAFLIGNESSGLTEESIALSDQAVRIPMQGKVESLNAGVAAALLVFEAERQRRAERTPGN
ncbi:MAG: RNA methyltransferase [Lachnospiraceae bacterium]|nr:RNA methyltransferase [Lachnospiraceae bacterium]